VKQSPCGKSPRFGPEGVAVWRWLRPLLVIGSILLTGVAVAPMALVNPVAVSMFVCDYCRHADFFEA
jgi:hypothetical protein